MNAFGISNTFLQSLTRLAVLTLSTVYLVLFPSPSESPASAAGDAPIIMVFDLAEIADGATVSIDVSFEAVGGHPVVVWVPDRANRSISFSSDTIDGAMPLSFMPSPSNQIIASLTITKSGQAQFAEVQLSGGITKLGWAEEAILAEYWGQAPLYAVAEDYSRLLQSVDSFGDQPLVSLEGAFVSAWHLSHLPSALPSTVRSLRGAFSSTYFPLEGGGARSFKTQVPPDLYLWDTSNVTDMSAMFKESGLSSSPQISGWNTSSVSDMSQMFLGVQDFNQDLSNWQTGSVSNFSNMFSGAENFNQDISRWDTSRATDMSGMFGDANSFDQNIGSWSVSGVTSFAWMFAFADEFDQDLGAWDLSSATNLEAMFLEAVKFNNSGSPSIENWSISSVTQLGAMFAGATSFNQPLDDWDTSRVWDMTALFQGASSFNQSLNTWETGEVRYLFATFEGASTFNGDISDWDTSRVESFKNMFRFAGDFNSPLGRWDTSSASDMAGMFKGAVSFNLDLSSWTVSNVIDMSEMFYLATSFNQDISGWDTSNVRSLETTFYRASNFNNGNRPLTWDTSSLTNLVGTFANATSFNQDLSSWNVRNVTSMLVTFQNANSFNNGGNSLSGWQTSSVSDMTAMFHNASSFDQDLSSWDVSSVTSLRAMFDQASSFSNGGQPIGAWDTSEVTNMDSTFESTGAFNQDLSAWDFSSVTSATDFLTGSGLDVANYDALLNSLAAKPALQLRVDFGGATRSQASNAAKDYLQSMYYWRISDFFDASVPAQTVPEVSSQDTSGFVYRGPRFNQQIQLQLNEDGSARFSASGDNLDGVLSLRIGSNYATILSVTSKSISATVTGLKPGTYSVVVTSNAGILSFVDGARVFKLKQQALAPRVLVLQGAQKNSSSISSLHKAKSDDFIERAEPLMVTCVAYSSGKSIESRRKALSRAEALCKSARQGGLAVRVLAFKAPSAEWQAKLKVVVG